MIDRRYYEIDPYRYYRDLLLAMAVFTAAFAWCTVANGPAFAVAFGIAATAGHRAAFFIHELTHQNGNPRLRGFGLFWDLTVGAFFLVPAARFFGAHLTHHKTGVFRTSEDPQYFAMRKNGWLAVGLLLLVPPLMPILQSALALATGIGGIAADRAIETFLLRRGMPAGSALAAKHQARVAWLSRYYLVAWTGYALLLPETLPLVYALHTAVWYLTTWRIPLEHRMESRLESSDKHDQKLDSFTVEAFAGELLQPIGLKYHTAHHMFAGVPYHNLPALHAELKASDPEYRRNVVSLWQAIRGVPAPPGASGDAG